MSAVTNALEEVREYFDNKADADHDQDGPIPNEELRLLALVDDALAQLKREAKERADLLTACRVAASHLREAVDCPRCHPIGRCPTLDRVEAAITNAGSPS